MLQTFPQNEYNQVVKRYSPPVRLLLELLFQSRGQADCCLFPLHTLTPSGGYVGLSIVFNREHEIELGQRLSK